MNPLALSASLARRLLLPTLLAAAASLPAPAQSPAIRIAGDLSTAQRSALPNSANPRAQAQYSTGRLAGSTRLQGMSLLFNRTQAQEDALKALLAAQQNPASPSYHKWLTSEQFAARFGMADSDLAKVQNWLEQQGFSIDSVSRGKDMIRFSGTAAQAESAFGVELHTYSIPTARGKESHFAPATALTVPTALSGVLHSVRGLDNFKPHTHLAPHRAQLKPNYTLNYYGSQYVFFDPGDIATVYDLNKEYNSSWTGSGQTITIIGQSAIATSDLDAFWTAAGITRDDPTVTLVPGTGDSSTLADGDEAESDLDLEWSGAVARGAALNFVYVGGSASADAFDSILYAIDNQLGNIISSSYGDCETDLGGYTLETYLERAASQGQTVLSASGDSGATDCLADTSLTLAQQQGLAVDYPASSPYVTAVGGTQISTANANYYTPGDGYWSSVSGSSTTVTSQNSTALQYIPEQAWNESSDECAQNATTAADAICAGGGGVSSLFTKPTWQTGVAGIPADGKRDVPDVALNAAIYYPGYLFCTSDTTFWDTGDGQVSSCTSGFLDSSTGIPTTGGGTSFATPIFAGMLAIINQQQSYTTGQGLVNPTLYTLAANSATYASAFHDITTGNNACSLSGYCASATTSNYSATTGYDLATGLGTVDLFNLASAWPVNTAASASLITTATTIAATITTPAVSANDTFTITVAPTSGSGTPTGTITITVDTSDPITETLAANGTYAYTTAFTTTGGHTIAVHYAGDSTYAASSGSITVTVPTTSSGTGTFKLSATNVTATQGTTGTSTITVTPAGGYTGTVELSFDTSNDNALANLCYEFTSMLSNGDGSVSVGGASAVTTQLQLDTNAADCASTNAIARTGKHQLRTMHAKTAANHPPADNSSKPLAAGIAFAGLLLAGFAGRSSRKLRGLAALLLLTAAGLPTKAPTPSPSPARTPPHPPSTAPPPSPSPSTNQHHTKAKRAGPMACPFHHPAPSNLAFFQLRFLSPPAFPIPPFVYG